jgi:hypothetical protein
MAVQVTVTVSRNVSVLCYLPPFSLVDEYICFEEIAASTFRITTVDVQTPNLTYSYSALCIIRIGV